MDYEVRHAEMTDISRICKIYVYARSFMAKHGNPNQWENHYPPVEQLIQDIKEEALYIVVENSAIHGVFYFRIEEDPTYRIIKDGNWRSDSSYGVIHRIAGDGSGGILKAAIAFCENRIKHLRIDTHHDNYVMQRALQKQGFHRCGIIFLPDGSPRIAYDRITE